MDSAEYWNKVAAIGQVAGAIATFLAVGFSLWQVRSERREALQASVGIRLMFIGDGSPALEVIIFNVINTGYRPITINSISWETGWFRGWAPEWLKKKYFLHVPNSVHSWSLPATLQPGGSAFFSGDSQDFLSSVAVDKIFFRKLPLFGWRRTKILARIGTTLGTHKAKVERNLIDKLDELEPGTD
jgi:hypothetical protein